MGDDKKLCVRVISFLTFSQIVCPAFIFGKVKKTIVNNCVGKAKAYSEFSEVYKMEFLWK